LLCCATAPALVTASVQRVFGVCAAVEKREGTPLLPSFPARLLSRRRARQHSLRTHCTLTAPSPHAHCTLAPPVQLGSTATFMFVGALGPDAESAEHPVAEAVEEVTGTWQVGPLRLFYCCSYSVTGAWEGGYPPSFLLLCLLRHGRVGRRELAAPSPHTHRTLTASAHCKHSPRTLIADTHRNQSPHPRRANNHPHPRRANNHPHPRRQRLFKHLSARWPTPTPASGRRLRRCAWPRSDRCTSWRRACRP
jgi:hypothetical protein